jgi:hypothetical protein
LLVVTHPAGGRANKSGNAVAYLDIAAKDNPALWPHFCSHSFPCCCSHSFADCHSSFSQGDATIKGGNAVEYLDIAVKDNPAMASGATMYLFVELVDTKRPASDVMRLKMRTWAGSVSITGSGSGLTMTAPTLTPHVNTAGRFRVLLLGFCDMAT